MPNVQTLEYFPGQIFRDKNGPCTVGVGASNAGVGNDNLLVTGVSGKIIRIISLVICSTGAVSLTTFKNGSGGTGYLYLNAPPTTLAPLVLPFNPLGWMDTSAGVGVYFDVAAVQTAVSVKYITYTP